MKTIGFIGAGNMGGALIRAASRSDVRCEILIADKISEKAEIIAKETNVKISSPTEIAEKCDLIFLGVKPNFMASSLGEIGDVLAKREEKPTLISMAAGVKIEKIAEMAKTSCPIIRIMPNMPVSVGEGMILYDTDDGVSEETEEFFLAVMGKSGKLDKIPEALIDAGSALSGCGPAFVFMFIEALADGGVSCGLPRDKALAYATQTLIGSAKMLEESSKHPGELKDAVCSPGGSTIEGVRTLEEGAFRGTVTDAVISSFEKTKMLGK
ncbi:MAG: pyrroline-5-carboxylate reductase [Ruminococcaceae bacterium]|nr:pyrroline-5-carboxylate reductase [Oscillospiraceae bacterium]